MATVGLVLDPVFERHDTGRGHPERAERLRAIREALEPGDLLRRTIPVTPQAAGDDLLLLAHDPDYVRHVAAACASGIRTLDSGDTAVCPESEGIARLATGSVVAACRGVASGAYDRAFAAVRPPGHHAERGAAMGFCLFNNVAIAARALRRDAGIERVLIVDWDVHHGNGTQHILEDDASVFYYSVHQSPLYPGTGAAHERGRGAGEGATLNHPLPPGAGDAAFLGALREDLERAADRFRPEFVLISAGFDAHEADPLAQLRVTTAAFGEATRVVVAVAQRHAEGRLVAVLEGGYDLDALGASVRVHVENLLRD